MRLHEDRELFRQTVLRTAQNGHISEGIVEKDYYVTLFLKEITKDMPDIVFKGGTSLAKCYRAIRRFSEDLDLSMICEGRHPTEGARKKLSNTIIETGKRHEMVLTNGAEVKDRRDFNRYAFDYGAQYRISALKPILIIETALAIRAFPTEEMTADSLMAQYLYDEGHDDLVAQYELDAFPVRVQAKERTFIDKTFALADYYLSGNVEEHSRHLYDIYKLLPLMRLDDEFRNLFHEVREVRKASPVCLSAKDDCNIRQVLQEIAERDIYRHDYLSITKDLLFEEVSYDTAKTALHAVIDALDEEE